MVSVVVVVVVVFVVVPVMVVEEDNEDEKLTSFGSRQPTEHSHVEQGLHASEQGLPPRRGQRFR